MRDRKSYVNVIILAITALIVTSIGYFSYTNHQEQEALERIRIQAEKDEAIRVASEKKLAELKKNNPEKYLLMQLNQSWFGKKSAFGIVENINSKRNILEYSMSNSRIDIKWEFCKEGIDYSVTLGDESIREAIAKRIIDEAGEFLSVIRDSDVYGNQSIKVKSLYKYTVNDDYGNSVEKERTMLSAYFNSQTCKKLYDAWDKGQSVKLAKIADKWYWDINLLE